MDVLRELLFCFFIQDGKDAPIFRRCSTCFDYGETLTGRFTVRRTQHQNSASRRHTDDNCSLDNGTAVLK